MFSDCLYPEFIDKINEIIQSKSLTYDDNGVDTMCRTLQDSFINNDVIKGYIQNLRNWLPTVL